jgi:endo-1,4-beta-xylanase
MTRITRRKFLKSSAFAGMGTALGAGRVLSVPSILTRPRVQTTTVQGELVFRPYFVQKGRGPHLLEWAYASDTKWDAFHSNITASKEGVRISDSEGHKRFGIDVRWNVEGFGYIFITADNGGEFYELPNSGKTRILNLNYELAKSRVFRNRRRVAQHQINGWRPSREAEGIISISEGYLDDAVKAANEDTRGGLAQSAMLYAMHGGEMIELEKARDDVIRQGYRPGFYLGCDARGMFEMHEDLFMERFTELFNYATITHVWRDSGVMEDFEPEEGKRMYEMRDLVFKKLRKRGFTVEGRPLFWFHKWVTPDWLKNKSFPQLMKYIESTTRDVIGHYGDGMYAWEIVNELHDWANECRLSPEQTVELTKFACEVAKDTAPGVHRLINNCCPYAEYVQLKEWSGQPATYPQRTPWQFTKDLVDAGVDFTLIGQQMYFPYRDLQDIVLLLERFESFGKPVQLSEIGAPGGPTERSVKLGKVVFPKDPYIWRRHWDEELQADWLESVYTLAYSKPFIEAANWFDFVDPYHFIDSGGLLRSSDGEKKAAFDRLANLENHWKTLPVKKQERRNR